MRFITNSQRKCFGLTEIQDHWVQIEVKPSPHDDFKTYAFLNGNTIEKLIKIGDNEYMEYALNEQISDDKELLLRKTPNGKDFRLSASELYKRSPIGMVLSYDSGHISLYSQENKKNYYDSAYETERITALDGFFLWAEQWEKETSEQDMENVDSFKNEKAKHVKYQEGDVFFFKINRRTYGYGRILLDYDKFRREGKPFWDILMGKALVLSVYHIVTDIPNLSISDIQKKKSLPSRIIADNVLYYGEYKIIGNIPVTGEEDYPIMYGRTISALDSRKTTMFQRGSTFVKLDNADPLHSEFTNNGVSFGYYFDLSVLKKCIKENSNEPYWDLDKHYAKADLRNPCNCKKLKAIEILNTKGWYKNMIEENDWRLEIAPNGLDNEELVKEDVATFFEARKNEWDGKNPFEFWDHDHCVFCYEKFMIETADKQPFAYHTQDYDIWICEICYNDFKERLNWKLVENKNGFPIYSFLIEKGKDGCIMTRRIMKK